MLEANEHISKVHAVGDTEADHMSKSTNEPSPLLCILHKITTFQGYGFKTYALKDISGHFIGNVKEGSPANNAGLLEDDHIMEVNGSPVSRDSHEELFLKIKSNPKSVKLLVIDSVGRKFYKERQITVDSGMSNISPLNHLQVNGLYFFYVI